MSKSVLDQVYTGHTDRGEISFLARQVQAAKALLNNAQMELARVKKERDEAQATLALLERYAANQGETPGGRADLALHTIRGWLEEAKEKAKAK